MRRTNYTIYSSLPRFRDRIEVIPTHLQGRYQGGLYNYKESIRLYQEAMNLDPLSDLYGIILHDMGASYVWSGRKKEALETFSNAFNVYRANDSISDKLGIARVHIARMNAYVYFGDFSRSFEGKLGKAEEDFVAGMQVCNPHDPILTRRNDAYTQDVHEVERMIQQIDVPAPLFDAYGASKAHCQYSWALLEDFTDRALWHARVAYSYARRINDFRPDSLWGWRDGVVGSTWRESLALFTIGDCYTLKKDIDSAREFYSKNEMVIPFNERRAYFQRHYYWLLLCREHQVPQARAWLMQTLKFGELDEYTWRVGLAHLHLGDLENYFANPRNRDRTRKEYETAVTVSANGHFELLRARGERKLRDFLETETFRP